MSKDLIKNRLVNNELSTLELYSSFKDKNKELSILLLIELYLLNNKEYLFELAKLYEKDEDYEELAKYVYLLDSKNNEKSKEFYLSLKNKKEPVSLTEGIYRFKKKGLTYTLEKMMYNKASKIKNEDKRIKKLMKLSDEKRQADASYDVGMYLVNNNKLNEAKNKIKYAALSRIDAALKYYELYSNDQNEVKDIYDYLLSKNQYYNIELNLKVCELYINNKKILEKKRSEVLGILRELFDYSFEAKKLLANFYLDEAPIISLFIFDIIEEENEEIKKIKENLLQENIININKLLFQEELYESQKGFGEIFDSCYDDYLKAINNNDYELLSRVAIYGHKPSLDICIDYYKEIDIKKCFELALHKYIFDKEYKEYDELNKIEINDFEYLKILDNYKYMLDNQYDNILDNKRLINKEVSTLISYYMSINKDTKRIKKEYKEYEKNNKNKSIIEFLKYLENQDNLNATMNLLTYYDIKNIPYEYDIEVHKKLALNDYIPSIKYVINYYKDLNKETYIEWTLRFINKSFVNYKPILDIEINALELYAIILDLMLENEKLDFNHFVFEKGEKDEEFYYLNKFFKISSIPIDEFLIYLEEYIYDDSTSLTVIDFIKYLKKNEEEIATKYVNLFARYKTHKDTLSRINEIIQENEQKEERRNKKISKYTRQFNRGNKKAALLLLKTKRKEITDKEKSEIYYKAMDRYDFYTIKRLVLDEGLGYISKYPKLLKMVVEASEFTTNVYADYIAAKVYESEEYSSIIKVDYSLEKAFLKYKKVENIKDEESIKKEVWARLGEMYEKGSGVSKSIPLAIHYYDSYYPFKVERLKKELEENKKKETPKVVKEEIKVKEEVKKPTKVYKAYYEYDDYEYIGQRLNNALELIKEYPCKEFEDLLTTNRYLRQNIIQAFMMKPDETIIKEFKRRDHLLSIGLKIDEIYHEDGTFNESLIAIKTAPKEVPKVKEEVKKTIVKESPKVTQLTPKEVPIITPQKDVKVTPIVEKVAEKPIVNAASPKKTADELLKELREKYNKPVKPTYSKELHGSLRNFEKNIMKEYYEKEDEYREKLLRIAPIIEEGKSDDYRDCYYNAYKFSKTNGYKHEYSSYYNKIHKNGKEGISLGLFTTMLESLMNNKYSYEEVKVNISPYVKINELYCLERLVLGLPTTLNELKVEITVGYISYSRVESSYLKAYEDYENSEISKIVSWNEYSDSSKSDIGASIYMNNHRDNSIDSQNRQAAKEKLKKVLFYEVRNLFNQYNVFYNECLTTNGVSRTVALRFKDISTTLHWNLTN